MHENAQAPFQDYRHQDVADNPVMVTVEMSTRQETIRQDKFDLLQVNGSVFS